MSRADQVFRRLLRLFPADFRGDFGDDMAATFHDQRRDALAHGDSMAAFRLWWDTIRGIAAHRNAQYGLSGVGQPESLVGMRVSPELFEVLGVAPALGRALTPEDDRMNHAVVVLSYGLWTRAFGRDATILGRSIRLDR